MAHNRLSQVLSVLVIALAGSVESSLEPRDDTDDLDVANDLDDAADLRTHTSEPPVPFVPVESPFWQSPEYLGEISGVAVDQLGFPVIFHRGDRTWGRNTFNENAEYQEEHRGPIRVDTVLTLHFETGRVVGGWGNHTFYLPHGIHIDRRGNIWLTDVALHQVFKYSPFGVLELILGQRFEPGTDLNHFCQPTAVAVLPNEEVVVADGYCNNRLLLFDRHGYVRDSINENWIPLNIPHALTVLPRRRQLCVADRENWRIVCLPWVTDAETSKNFVSEPSVICNANFGRIFGITSYHGSIYAVNGPTLNSENESIEVRGFIVNPSYKNVTFWGPKSSSFENPHAIAVCPRGTAVYVSEIGPNRVWKFDLLKSYLV